MRCLGRLKQTGGINTVVERHGAEEYTRDGAGGQKRTSLREIADTKEQVSDAPAGLPGVAAAGRGRFVSCWRDGKVVAC